MADFPPIDDLMRFAGRAGVNRDWPQRLPIDTSDDGYYSKDFNKDMLEINKSLHTAPEVYQDPAYPDYVEVPATEKLLNNKRKGPEALKKMIQERKLPYATDELPDPGSPAYKRMSRESIKAQRGPKEKL